MYIELGKTQTILFSEVNMKRILAVILAALMALVCVPIGAKVQEPEKDLVGTDLSGVNAPYLLAGGASSTTDFLTSADFAAHSLTLLTVWDNKCGYCQAEMPFLQRLHEEVPDLLVVGVCTQGVFLGGTYAAGWNYLQANGYTYLNVKPDAAIGQLIEGMNGVPFNFLIDGSGVVIKVIGGAVISWSEVCEEIAPVLGMYTDRTCTVTFKENAYGTVLGTQELSVGETPVYPAAPAFEGHNFSGWDIGTPCPVLTDITVTAEYTLKAIVVKFFDSITGEKIKSKTSYWGYAVEPPEAPEHEGYTFVGWDHDLSCVKESCSIYTVYYEGTPLDGDVNLDGSVSGDDALIALRAAMEMQQLTDAEHNMADYNGDGIVDSTDALLILRASMGLD